MGTSGLGHRDSGVKEGASEKKLPKMCNMHKRPDIPCPFSRASSIWSGTLIGSTRARRPEHGITDYAT